MADTARSLADLVVLLADNTNEAISPQDLRDMLKSLTPPFGSLYLTTPAETSISVSGTYVKTSGTTVEQNTREFTHSNGRLTYTGNIARHMHIATTISFTSTGSNKLIAFKLAKNGVVEDGSKTPRKTGTGSDVGSLALHWDLTLNTGDYIEIWVTNDTDTTNITLEHFYMFALGMLV